MYYPIFENSFVKLVGIITATLLLFFSIFILTDTKRSQNIKKVLFAGGLISAIQTYYLMLQEWLPAAYHGPFLGLSVLYGPILLYYTQNYVLRKKTIQKADYLNILPFVLVSLISFYPGFYFTNYPMLVTLIIVFHWAAFFVYIGFWLYQHKKELGLLKPYESRWIKAINLINLQVWIMLTLLYCIQKPFRTIYICYIFISAILLSFFYFKFRNSQWESAEKTGSENKKAHHKITLPENTHIYLNKLHKLMNEDKLYLDANLTIPRTADRMNIQPYLLSQIINTHFAQSFPDYINSFRINDAQELLQESSLKISSIAMDCGFNTLSSFNLAFKKVTQRTPSDYRSSFQDD